MPLGNVSPELGYASSNPLGGVRPSEGAHCSHEGAISGLSCHAVHDESIGRRAADRVVLSTAR
ncbi:MAG: hypothetical protein NVS3B26_18830 [Mycobacteriales bacterium]